MLPYQSPGVSEFDLLTDTPASYVGHGGKIVRVTGAETGLEFTNTPTFASVTVTDGGTVGQAAGPLLTFDDTNNFLEITGCNVGIGISIPAAMLHVFDTAYPVAQHERSTAILNDVRGTTRFLHTTSGNMVDGFGVSFELAIQDDAAAINTIASIRGLRDGADNTGKLELQVPSAGVFKTRLSLAVSEVVVNENGDNVNLRVETSGNANMLFVDGGNNRVGIGTATPGAELEVAAATVAFLLNATGGFARTLTISCDGTSSTFSQGFAGYIQFGANLGLRLDSGAAINTVMVKSTGRVGFGVFAPVGKVHIDQATDDAAIPVLTLDQADISEGFIDFIGSDRGAIAGATNSAGSVRAELGGTVYRLALYADA